MNAETQHDTTHASSEHGQTMHEPTAPAQENALTDTLPIVDPMFIEADVPESVVAQIRAQLEADEQIFVLFRLNAPQTFPTEAGKTEKNPLWMVITGTRLFLLALSAEGRVYSEIRDQQTVIEYQNGLSRDVIKIADTSLATGFWEGSKRKFLKEAVNLFPLPEYEKYLYLANMYLKDNQGEQAIPLLRKSLACVPTINASLLLVHILAQTDQREEALEVLHEALQRTEAASLLHETQRLFADDVKMLLYLAASFEDHQQWDVCITIYQSLLRKTPDFDLYYLKLGEMYTATHDSEAALPAYQRFITLRTESEKSAQGDFL
ncbi:hypothetical protein GF339_16470, partial [candidate division KSB3 bacterium]|nr:hypothetical protein [candidate division KSB3 bacterium]MBD3326183.1 hypothetical protein [candidate division KSB3 bacterium]